MGSGGVAGGEPVPGASSEFKADKFFRPTITKRIDFTPDLWAIRLDPTDKFQFYPGQYATLAVQPSGEQSRPIERAYSIVSSPHEAELEFFFELVPHGGLTPLLYKLQVGHQLLMRKIPKGRFMLEIRDADNEADPTSPQPQPRTNHLLVSTVTGVAPFVSYVRTLNQDWKQGKFPGAHKLYILNGASHSWEFGYSQELAAVAAEAPWLTYVETISRPWDEAGWRKETGRVDDLLRKYADQWGLNGDNTTGYLCGHPEMVAHSRGILERRGFPKKAIKEEIYWIPPKAPKS